MSDEDFNNSKSVIYTPTSLNFDPVDPGYGFYSDGFELDTLTSVTLMAGSSTVSSFQTNLNTNSTSGTEPEETQSADAEQDAQMTVTATWIPNDNDPVTNPAPSGNFTFQRVIQSKITEAGSFAAYIDDFGIDSSLIGSPDMDGWSTATDIAFTVAQSSLGHASQTFSFVFTTLEPALTSLDEFEGIRLQLSVVVTPPS